MKFMKTLYGISNLKKSSKPSAVSVGIFDGVHIGHKEILSQLIRYSKRRNLQSVVVTFDPHPAKVLKKGQPVAAITSLGHRLRLLEKSSVDKCLVISFDKAFAKKSAHDFVDKLLVDKLNMKALIVGGTFSFGREQVKTIPALKKIADKFGFKLMPVKPKHFRKRTISSSLIRHLIEKGRLKTAESLLSRPVSILGTVIKGRKRGRIIGFRTANINPHHEAIPPGGVYAAHTVLDKKRYKSVVNIGRRPTFNEKEPSIEVHIFGINRDIYGKDIEVLFKKRLRSERRFKNENHLRAQIIKDAHLAQKLI